MVSKQISDSITKAKEALDRVAIDMGEVGFDICERILNNNKAFIHDKEVWKIIHEHEEKLYAEIKKKRDEALIKLKDKSPLDAYEEAAKYDMKIRDWKSKDLLSFWDQLSKEHDI